MVKLYVLSKLLTIIGALNWGLVGLLDFNLVESIFGKKSMASKIVYILVGLAGFYLLMIYKAKCIAMKHHELTKSQHHKGKHDWSKYYKGEHDWGKHDWSKYYSHK
jgi:uncharacterized membrane protein YuzA (DUF378 family)